MKKLFVMMFLLMSLTVPSFAGILWFFQITIPVGTQQSVFCSNPYMYGGPQVFYPPYIYFPAPQQPVIYFAPQFYAISGGRIIR